MAENKLTLINNEGEEELATILFTHESEGKKYVVFEFDVTGDVSAAEYEEVSETEGKFLDIETDEEWEMLTKLLDSYLDDLQLEDEEN